MARGGPACWLGMAFRGAVSVREGQSKGEQLLICGPESSDRICIEP